MNRPLAPDSIAPPAANYAHGVHVAGATEWVHTSGVVPTAPDGTVPEDVGDQAEVVWANIAAILAEGGFDGGDVVSVTTYVVVDEMASLGAVMGARDRALQGRRVASTLVTVPALADTRWKMEIAVVAARSAGS
jgi:2-iminobutanoate/2-iminopropanoate deaminase